MVQTPEEREAALARDRRSRTPSASFRLNPAFGTSPFDPNAALAVVPSDPKLAEPLPQGRYIDPRIPSQVALARAEDIKALRQNSRAYVQEHAGELNNEQSLMDKGKTMLSRLFDYQDDADAQLFGVDVSAVESVWDTSLRYLTGAYDLLNVGIGGLISAAPGGIRTLTYDELSGGKDVGEVLSGEMEPGSAPSPGQIAVASVAAEAKRIREGKTRLSDVLLMNPATAPFILAGLAAESSPLQQDDFDIMNKEQREKAFGSGYEQWMSGITDFGLMFADPLIGAGVAAKVVRAGKLGARNPAAKAKEIGAVVNDAIDKTTTSLGDLRTPEEFYRQAFRLQADTRPDETFRAVKESGNVEPIDWTVPTVWDDTPIPDAKTADNILQPLMMRIAQKSRETGKKVMDQGEIENLPEFKSNPNRGAIAKLLYDADNIYEVGLVLDALHGAPQAMERIGALAPMLADQILTLRRYQVAELRAATEPAKIKEAADYLARVGDNLQQDINSIEKQIGFLEAQMGRISPTPNLRGPAIEQSGQYTRLKQQRDTLQKSLDESQVMQRMIRDGEIPDFLDQRNPFFRPDQADQVLADLHRRREWADRLINNSIYESAQNARFQLPSRNNAYARMVSRSRQRRGKAAYQYSVEKTSWIPKRRLVSSTAAGQKYEWDFWSASEFQRTTRLQRQVRVWRWLGTEVPSGYIGLKGTSTVGSEREFTAALDLDVYRGEPVTVTLQPGTSYINDAGKRVTVDDVTEITLGGNASRQKLFERFYEALNDPSKDSYKALLDVEEKVMDDLRLVYGYQSKTAEDTFQGVLRQANRNRAADLDRLRRTGTVVDSGEIHYVPYLETHLANGTYMQNFQSLEQMLRRDSLQAQGKGAPSRLMKQMEIPAHLAGSAYETFNNLWRPATLLRLSYTQRNVFEGMVRAMAYSASLAPLSWPIRGTYNGTRNAIVKRVSAARVKTAQRKIEQSEFGSVWREYTAANDVYYRLQMARENIDPKTKKAASFTLFEKVPGQPTRYETIDVAEYNRRVKAADDRRTAAENLLNTSDTVAKFTEAVKGTAFGQWRQKQLDDLAVEIQSDLRRSDAMQEAIAERTEADPTFDPFDDPEILEWFGTADALLAEKLKKQDLLQRNPLAAIQEYGAAAGRQKRIGSGTALGPDGNRYGNAFDGPLESINRQLASADNTTKQNLSGSSGVFGNIFYKMAIRDNPVIEYTPKTADAWAKGLSDAIEDASSSRVIRMLMDNVSDDFTTFDVDRVATWMMSADPEAKRFTTQLMSQFGSDAAFPVSIEDVAKTDASIAMFTEDGKRLRPFAKERDLAVGGKIVEFDPAAVHRYVDGVADTLVKQMQGNREFFQILQRRIREKTDMRGAEGRPVSVSGVDPEEIKRILNAMDPEQRNALGTIQGSELIQMGTDTVMGWWAKSMNKLFNLLGTMPEDAITRGPFYNMRYKEARNNLIEAYWAREGMTLKEVRAANKRARTKSGREEGGTIEHPEFKIKASELSRIEVLAHRQALMDTREWMYTIERRTKLGKYGEWIYPFISATQNTATVTGKLLWKEPWLAPMIAAIWQAPNRLGIEDENGNIRMPMPFTWVRDMLQDNPDIPFLGGAIDSADTLLIPKNGLNVWMPETGFGLVPTPAAWVQVGASELMKAGAFPVETPPIFTRLFGEEVGNQLYTSLKDYMFGEGQGMSDKLASWDMLFPASVQKLINMKDEMSAQYGYQYAMQWHTQMLRARGMERDDVPTEAEIHKRTTNMFWFQFFGNIGLPTPLTPYPILTRPQVEQTPVKALQDVYGKLRTADPLNASLNMERMFGDYGLAAALTKVTTTVGGAQPTPETVSDIQTLQPLIRKVAPDLGDNLNVLGILVNNRTPRVGYEQSAYQWQKSERIPGRGETWRAVQTPEMSEQERQRIVGWTIYRKAIDILDAQLQNAGFESYEVAGAAEFKAAKEILIQNMSENPDYRGWWIDYQDIGGNRTGAAVRTMTMALEDPEFASFMVKSGKERTLAAMQEYIQYRNMVMNVVESTGKSIDHDDNILLKMSWANIRQRLRNSDDRWAEIEDLYLSGDTTPKSIGTIVDPNEPLLVGAQ